MGVNIDTNFISHHLANPPPGIFHFDREKILTNKIQTREASESVNPAGLVTSLVSLLTMYSKLAHGTALGSQYPYIFIRHHQKPPPGSPLQMEDGAEFLAIPGHSSERNQAPGHLYLRETPRTHAISLVRCNPQSEDEYNETVISAHDMLEARPDLAGIYALWANSDRYQILWVDASGVITSDVFEWDDLVPLQRRESQDLWTIHVNEANIFRNLARIFSGTVWGRRTNVFTPADVSSESVLVVKDSWRDQKRYYQEDHALEAIHKNGIFPGVVRLLIPAEESMPQRIATAPAAEGFEEREERVKSRLVMGSTGTCLLRARSVLDILMAVFDIIEIHRELVLKYNILHRDMSYYNILIYPQHDPKTREKPFIESPPLFIRQILEGQYDSQGIDRSSGLLIDFDNYANFEVDDEEAKRQLTFWIGTPKFIARSVAERTIRGIASHQPYQRMPLLREDKARQLYKAAYGSTEYTNFTDSRKTIHRVDMKAFNERYLGAVSSTLDSVDSEVDDLDAPVKKDGSVGKGLKDQTSKRKPFRHLPEHDVESLFWVLLYTLIRANPVSRSKVTQESKEAYWKILEAFENHRIDDTQLVDSRSGIFSTPEDELRKMLHPDLGVLSGMLYQMAQQIYPEYAHLPTAPNPVHLHEAMRRLLLDQIVKMEKKPIPLRVGKPRPPRPDEDNKPEQSQGQSATSAKRKYETEQLDRKNMPHHVAKRRK